MSRNFSNRTKTGCLTCRERKKKCDEGKPTCNNCDRGGFFCKGYSQPNPMYKASGLREQPALHVKNGFYDQIYSQRPLSNGDFYTDAGTADASTTREDKEASRTAPSTHHPAASKDQWHGPFSTTDAHTRSDFASIVQLSDMSPGTKNVDSAAALLQSSRDSSHADSFPDQRTTAQLALQHGTNGSSRRPRDAGAVYGSEKEKMLHGVAYDNSDVELKAERQRCRLAVWEFNQKASDPQSSAEECAFRFRRILQPTALMSPPPGDKPERGEGESDQASGGAGHGRVGEGVEVEAPFYCTYGYNVEIGNDVEIGANCRILDACPVRIGDRCFIGPDVSIYTVDGEHAGAREAGQKRRLVAQGVTIGEDCWIGGRVMIMPGVSIGKGSTIGAGTKVFKVCHDGVFAVEAVADGWT